MNTMRTLARREFLAKGARALAAAAVCDKIPPADARAATPGPSAYAIPTRALGKTGLKLPILGYGGAALPKAWGNPLSHEDRVALVRYAFDRGIRYFDTAGNYMESQTILGEALRDRRRQVCLVTKVETTRLEEVRKAVEKSLKELQSDYLDILLIHGTPGLEQMSVEQAMKIHAELVKLRNEKITRFIGFSAHGYFDKALALIHSGGFDVCMLSCGYVPRGHSSVWTPRMTKLRDDCLAKAHELGMGIVAIKVIGGGWLGRWSGYVVPGFDKQRLAQLPGAAIRHVLQDPRVHVLAIGMHLQSQIDANLHRYDPARPLENWVSRLAVNVCLNALRARRRRPELRWADLSEQEQRAVEMLAQEAPAQQPPYREAKTLLATLMEGMAPEDRMVLTLFHLEERSIAEVAELTGWNVAVIKMRAFRARRKLRRLLEALERARLNWNTSEITLR